jgi:hypothetical protein
LKQAEVLRFGDLILHYSYGHVQRISPEAPVPGILIERETRAMPAKPFPRRLAPGFSTRRASRKVAIEKRLEEIRAC